jgi:hypothetical protein
MPTTREVLMLLRLRRRGSTLWVAHRILFRMVGGIALLVSLSFRLCSQSPAAPAQSPPADRKDSPPKSSAPAKPKKVITNEDFEARSTAGQAQAPGKVVVADSGSLMKCEATCEQEARQQLGYDADREAEWRMQIVSARSDLASDTAWRELLGQAIQQTTSYCNLLAQRSQKVSPSANTFYAGMQRARAEQYFQDMEHALRQSIQAVAGRMNAMIQQVNTLSPMRAALMSVQQSRILSRECELPSRR